MYGQHLKCNLTLALFNISINNIAESEIYFIDINNKFLLNICVVTGRANITYYGRSQSIIKLKVAYHRAIIGLFTWPCIIN